jgi:hypothetical protein
MKRGSLHVAAAVGLAALVAVFAVSVGTSSAPAGGVPEAQLTGFMDKVTYGGNAAYTSTFTHTGKSQTHVRFHNPIPENGDGDEADLVYASCSGVETATEFVCDPIKLKKGEVATVTVAWKTFADGSSDCDGAEPCFANEGFWTSDAGTNAPQKPKKTTTIGVETELLAADDPNETATYALDGCLFNEGDPASTATLKTFLELDDGNPLATIVCIPDFTQPGQFQPGLVGSVLEGPTDQAGAVGQGSDVCVAVSNCGSPFTFGSRITFVFLIDEDTFFPPVFDLFSSYYEYEPESPVTTVFHDGDELLFCDDEGSPDTDPCVESIETDGYGTTTVVATGTDNGSWDFG